MHGKCKRERRFVQNFLTIANPSEKNQRGLPEKYAEIKNQLFSSRMEVQCGQRVASMAISDRQYGHFLVVGAMRPISEEIMSSVRDETMFGEYCQLYVYMCAKSEKTDARIGHPLEVIRTTRNRQK